MVAKIATSNAKKVKSATGAARMVCAVETVRLQMDVMVCLLVLVIGKDLFFSILAYFLLLK